MDSSQLLNRTLANRLVCQTQQIAIGPTGPTGSPAQTIGITNSFTLFIDYTSTKEISRVQVPPGMFTNPLLSSGGVFTENVGTDLVFLDSNGVGLDNITCANTSLAFVIAINCSGYTTASGWMPISAGNIRPRIKIWYSVTADNAVRLNGLTLPNMNGANLRRPTSGIAAGFLTTVTIFFYQP